MMQFKNADKYILATTIRRKKMVKKISIAWSLIFIAISFIVCQTGIAKNATVVDIANDIVKDVGSVGEIYSNGKQGFVFVFEEYHTSRVGRLQIAVMLTRLHEKYNLKKIGLEGAMQSQNPLSGNWFHNAGGNKAKYVREDVAIRMLTEGEINSPEFMELVYPNIEVYGTELKSEYNVKLDTKSSPRAMYLIAIAQKYPFTQDQIKKINSLIKDEKVNDAIEYMLNTDPWTREKYALFKDKLKISTQEFINQIDEITKKARKVSAQIDPQVKKDMENTRKFFKIAHNRSITMVKYVVGKLIEKKSFRPVAMIIGAAHTQEVIDELKARKVSCVQITPIDLSPDFGQLSFEEFELKNFGKWAQNSPGTLGNLLNSKRNPPPMIETSTAKSYASMHMASILLAEAVRFGHKIPPVPDDLKKQLDSLPEIKINYKTIKLDGNDVIFNALLKDTTNKEISVWARVGTVRSIQKDITGEKSIEEKLMTEISEIKNNSEANKSKEDPSKPSKNVGKKGGGAGQLKLMALSRNVKGKFANNKDAVLAEKSISQ